MRRFPLCVCTRCVSLTRFSDFEVCPTHCLSLTLKPNSETGDSRLPSQAPELCERVHHSKLKRFAVLHLLICALCANLRFLCICSTFRLYESVITLHLYLQKTKRQAFFCSSKTQSTCIRNTGSALRRSDELQCCIVFIVLFVVGGETEALLGQSVA